jgi:hypothetical protein
MEELGRGACLLSPWKRRGAGDAPSAVPGGETLVATRVRSSSPQSSQQQNET